MTSVCDVYVVSQSLVVEMITRGQTVFGRKLGFSAITRPSVVRLRRFAARSLRLVGAEGYNDSAHAKCEGVPVGIIDSADLQIGSLSREGSEAVHANRRYNVNFNVSVLKLVRDLLR
jgi:hypothetical protein